MSRELSRWSYLHGSRPEGCIEYDEPGLKFQSHHDTDVARGQNSAYDLVRLHLFGKLDADAGHLPVGDRPSTAAMARLINECPEIIAARASSELEDLGPVVTEEVKVDDNGNTTARFAVHSASEFSSGPAMGWIVRGLLPRAELAFIFGEPGSAKSFIALDLCAAIARGIEWRGKRTAKGRVAYVCAEGASGFKARLRAYASEHKVDLAEFPLGIVSDAPNLLDPRDAAAITKAIVDWAKGLAE